MGFTKQDMINLQNLLREKKQTITVAESCTGGLIASKITAISGSSDVFKGSIVTYSNDIKHQELNVQEETLKNFGAVSKEVVQEMLSGVLIKFDADFAIAISGIAGPNGGTQQKPVGTVVIGIASKNGTSKIKIYQFLGTRTKIQKISATKALEKVFKLIKSS